MTVIATSTIRTATAYSNQRKIDRCSNGVLWMVYRHTTTPTTIALMTRYSTDNGVTWNVPANGVHVNNGSGLGTTTYAVNGSFFIDADDYAHAVFKDNDNGGIYYRRGTPNATRTEWTWSAATQVNGSSGLDYPDIIAHQEGAGWCAHLVSSYVTGSANYAYHWKIDISSSGTITVSTANQIGNSYSNTAHTHPSIDFHHTGDGKTVAGGTPHLFAAWSAGTTGTGKGIRFKKATYSGGAWTWGTEREIDTTRYKDVSTAGAWLATLFDGTRVVIGGFLHDGGSARDLIQYERDTADTATTTRILVSDNSLACPVLGSFTYDGDGNTYYVGRFYDTANRLGYLKWDRISGTLDPLVIMANPLTSEVNASVKRGYSFSKIEFVYTDGSASPFSVIYDSIVLNSLPTAPTNVTVVSPAVAGQGADASWQHNDSDGDPQVKWKYRLRKV